MRSRCRHRSLTVRRRYVASPTCSTDAAQSTKSLKVRSSAWRLSLTGPELGPRLSPTPQRSADRRRTRSRRCECRGVNPRNVQCLCTIAVSPRSSACLIVAIARALLCSVLVRVCTRSIAQCVPWSSTCDGFDDHRTGGGHAAALNGCLSSVAVARAARRSSPPGNRRRLALSTAIARPCRRTRTPRRRPRPSRLRAIPQRRRARRSTPASRTPSRTQTALRRRRRSPCVATIRGRFC